MPLFVLDKAPIIGTVFQYVIFYDLIFRCIIRIFADPSCKFRMIGINTRIDYGNCYAASARIAPCLSDVQIVEMRLTRIIFVCYGIVGAGGQAFYRFIFDRRGPNIIVQRQLRKICTVRTRCIHVVHAHILRKCKCSEFTVIGNAKLCMEFLRKRFRFTLRSIIQNKGMLVIGSPILLQLFQCRLL